MTPLFLLASNTTNNILTLLKLKPLLSPDTMSKNKKYAPYLPEDILTNIFSRLGVKSLVQCKPVCKTWLSVISNQAFVRSQLLRAIVDPTLLIIHSPKANAVDQLRMRTEIKDFPSFVMPRRFERCEVVSCSYNGLICLCGDDDAFYIWNPSIGEFKTLPPTPPRCTTRDDKIGFGYDCISDDYKIFMTVFESLSDYVPKVYVYSSNANSWRQLQQTALKELYGYNSTDIVVNGVLYIDNGDDVISFDLHNEVVGQFLLPDHEEAKMSSLLDFDGSLAVILRSIGDAPGIDLWKLDVVSVPMRWTINIRINPYSDSNLWFNCYLGAGVFYGVMSIDPKYFLHNILYDYEMEETEIYGYRENVCAILKYIQTLVSLNGFEAVE